MASNTIKAFYLDYACDWINKKLIKGRSSSIDSFLVSHGNHIKAITCDFVDECVSKIWDLPNADKNLVDPVIKKFNKDYIDKFYIAQSEYATKRHDAIKYFSSLDSLDSQFIYVSTSFFLSYIWWEICVFMMEMVKSEATNK